MRALVREALASHGERRQFLFFVLGHVDECVFFHHRQDLRRMAIIEFMDHAMLLTDMALHGVRDEDAFYMDLPDKKAVQKEWLSLARVHLDLAREERIKT